MTEPIRHPRYPKHKGDKGIVHGGECNRTACSRLGAEYFNSQTFGYYCFDDALGINWNPKEPAMCVYVDHQLSREEMDEACTEFWRQMEKMKHG